MQRFWCLPSVYVQHAQLGFSGRTAAMAQSQMMEAVDIQGDFQVIDFLWNLLEQMCHRIRGFLEVEAQLEASRPLPRVSWELRWDKTWLKHHPLWCSPNHTCNHTGPFPSWFFLAKRISLASSQQDSWGRWLEDQQPACSSDGVWPIQPTIPVHLYICLSVCQSVCLSVCLSIYLSIDLWIYPSIHLSTYLFVRQN